MWAEDFLAHGTDARPVFLAIDERRKVTAVAERRLSYSAAIEQHGRAFLLGQGVVGEHFFDRTFMNHRAGEALRIKRVADDQALRRVHELLSVLIEDTLLNEKPAGRDAALPAGLERAQDARGHGQVQLAII